jgi:phosphate transport system permease protein
MIGMVAFIVDIPGGITDPSTVLPVQIYLWADSPNGLCRAHIGGHHGLLAFLIVMNAAGGDAAQESLSEAGRKRFQ